METTNKNISESEKFMRSYNNLLQEVKLKFKVKNANLLELSQPKVSRLYNGQFDILTLIEIASLIGIDTELTFNKRL